MQLRQFPGSPTGWPTSRRSSGSRRSSASTASTTSRSSRPTSLWPSAERRRFESRPADKKTRPCFNRCSVSNQRWKSVQWPTIEKLISHKFFSENVRKKSGRDRNRKPKKLFKLNQCHSKLRLPPHPPTPTPPKKSINCTLVSKLKSKPLIN